LVLRLGLFIYDHIGGRKRLPATRFLRLRDDPAGAPLKRIYRKGFEYSDCRVDDARLVVLNARDAADRGADIRTRTRVVEARREADHWRIKLRNEATGRHRTERARLLVNAAGPWVDTVLRDVLPDKRKPQVRLVQGSHIVVPKLYDHDRCYIFQNSDGRIVFAIPFERDFTLIGTTDRDYEGDPGEAAISDDEIDYLCGAASGYFRDSVSADQVIWTFSGVRPLFDDGASKAQEATRDYVLKVEGRASEAALVNIFGGKLTTYRRLAEAVLEEVGGRIGAKGGDWTGGVPLPGGDFPVDGLDAEVAKLTSAHGYLDPALARRLVRSYGTLAHEILKGARGLADLGTDFGLGLYQREVEYLIAREWAVTAEDILWRRTKLGLRLSDKEVRRLAAWLKSEGAKLASRVA
jgi:glycerol-3-phosphate dehydrogenase